jgi:hypothetical protein
MVTSVIGYYFTHLNVTYFSSFWFLGGSDTGLAVLTPSFNRLTLKSTTTYSNKWYTPICSTTISCTYLTAYI